MKMTFNHLFVPAQGNISVLHPRLCITCCFVTLTVRFLSHYCQSNTLGYAFHTFCFCVIGPVFNPAPSAGLSWNLMNVQRRVL